MGASGSKAATKVVRKFPPRSPGAAPPAARRATAPPAPPAPASFTKDEALPSDAVNQEPNARSDPISPDFASRLQQMGIAQPNTIYSTSSIANPARGADVIPNPQDFSAPQFPAAGNNVTLGVLEARRQLEQRATEELDKMGRTGYQGREFLDIAIIRKILVMRQRGDSASSIETRLRLKPGVVSRLGPMGVVSPAS